MIKHKKNLLVYLLLITFVAYVISILLSNNLWSNILSPTVAFFSSFVILLYLKQVKNYKFYVNFLFLSTFVWGLADLLWLIYDDILSIDPTNASFIDAIYILPNLFILISLIHYIIKNYNKWNLYQMFIDIVTISIVLSLLLWSLLFSKTSVRFNLNFDQILIIICVFMDFCIITIITLIVLSKGIRKISKGVLITFFGILIFSFADYYYYIYLDLINVYLPNTIIDAIYMFSIVLFAIGVIFEAKFPSAINKLDQSKLSENLRKPRKIVFIYLVLFYLLYLIRIFNLHTFIVISIINVLSWILTTIIRANKLDKLLLQTEREMGKHLENLVNERTKELDHANRYLEEISNRDVLTGLYNRRYFSYYFNLLLNSNINKTFALLFIDANRFKSINDSYGHEVGDKILHDIGERFLKHCNSNCTSFRIGGDEFAVIIENFENRDYVDLVVKKIFETLKDPILVPPYSFTITASIGISLYPEDAKDMDTLMRYADIAMYEAKLSNYKNKCLYFSMEFIDKLNRKQEIELYLHNITDYDKEFILYFQPQYCLKNNSLIGMEALIRWMHPEKGFIPPSEFIPIAEETGVIIDIGDWVIDKAFSQIIKWNLEYSLDLKISINISPIQFQSLNFMDWFRGKLNSHGVKPAWVDVEITESCAMNSDVSIVQIFDLLNEIGVKTSIDDFGTGYSSLSYIKRFKIERLKIAKELIDNIDYDENTLLIVKAIIMMANGLKLKTIAEGVEDLEQLKILEDLGCTEIQGYIFGKPVPSEEFEKQHIKANSIVSIKDCN